MPSISIPTMMAIATGTALAGAGVAAYGQYEQGQAAAGAAHYNASVANKNSIVAAQNAQIAMEAGEAQTGMQGQKTRAQVGSIRAEQSASGVEVGSGSAAQTQLSQRELGELDAQSIRSNAIKEAYGLNVQSSNYKAEAGLKELEGSQAKIAGALGASSTFLSGVGDAANSYSKYQMQSGKSFAG